MSRYKLISTSRSGDTSFTRQYIHLAEARLNKTVARLGWSSGHML